MTTRRALNALRYVATGYWLFVAVRVATGWHVPDRGVFFAAAACAAVLCFIRPWVGTKS